MTKCTSTSLSFSPLNRKKIEASFTDVAITSDAGLLLIREVDKQLGLTKQLATLIDDHRHAGYVQHPIEHLLKQRIYAIAAGYEDVNDHDVLRNDPCFQTLVGREVALASPATLSRFENAINRSSLVAMSKQIVEVFVASHKTPPSELILDIDPTDHELYGHQENRHYHGYYKHHCFLPLHIFCGDHLLVSLLRPSNIDGAKYAGAIVRLMVKRFREAWPTVKITIRGDCAFARKRLLHWCEKNNVGYVIGMASNARLKQLAQPLTKQAEQQYEKTQEKQREFAEYQYGAKTWKCERRIIAKAEHHANGTNLRFIISNLTDAPQALYDAGYCPRGNMENGIKQLKLDLFSDRNSCTDFLANQFRLLLSSFAYVLMSALQREHLKKTPLKKAYCGTIRLKLLKIGAVMLKNTRKIIFLCSSSFAYQDVFATAAQSLSPT